tara:strand:+ start:104 stop:544 length:441 start_codon:yes stop_codon:yes gene_type:complete
MAEKEKKHGVKNPNEGTDGKLASNKTGEAIEPNYDYGNITDSDKKVVTEIIDLLRARGSIPCSMVAEEFITRFQLEEIPMKPIEQSLWHQFTKNERIGSSMQGFRETKDENGKKIRIPHIGFSADLDYLDEMIQRIAKKVKEIPTD